jgi:hypothetical protein
VPPIGKNSTWIRYDAFLPSFAAAASSAQETIVKLHTLIFGCPLLALAVPLLAYADFVLPNLPTGSKYELAFVTRDATSPYIADYNSFVAQEAGQNTNLPKGITWDAIASTVGDINTGLGMADADANAPFTSTIPVYNTAGQLVANATTPLYNATGTLINPIEYDQFGNAFPHCLDWVEYRRYVG